MTSSARSIDGSKVVTVGTINLSFRLGKTYRRMNCRVVRNLIHDLVLGWDFFEQYDAQLYAKDGYLMCQGERINLLPQMSRLGGARYAMMEEFVIPPASKAQFQAALLVDSSELDKATNLVCMEPADLDEVDIRTARCISKVEDGKVLVEAINPFGHSVKIPEGTILGFAEFITEKELDQISEYAGMDVKYDSAYESMEDSDVGSSSDAWMIVKQHQRQNQRQHLLGQKPTLGQKLETLMLSLKGQRRQIPKGTRSLSPRWMSGKLTTLR